MYAQKNIRSGFTLIEMLIVLAIMGVLIGIITPAYLSYTKSAKKKATVSSIKVLKQSLEVYREDVGEYPQALRDLVKNPGNVEGWDGPYVTGKDVPKDGFGKPFHYTLTPGQEYDYELYSYGAKGKTAPKSEWIDAHKID